MSSQHACQSLASCDLGSAVICAPVTSQRSSLTCVWSVGQSVISCGFSTSFSLVFSHCQCHHTGVVSRIVSHKCDISVVSRSVSEVKSCVTCGIFTYCDFGVHLLYLYSSAVFKTQRISFSLLEQKY